MQYDQINKSEATVAQGKGSNTYPGKHTNFTSSSAGMPQYLQNATSQLQRQPIEEEEDEELQAKQVVNTVQRQPLEEEDETAQMKSLSTPLQAKLTVSQPDDPYEKEADRVADQVMRMPESKIQRQSELDEEEEEPIQAKPVANTITPLIQRQAEPEEEEEQMPPEEEPQPEESAPILDSTPTQDADELSEE